MEKWWRCYTSICDGFISLQSYSCFCERSFFLKVWWGEGEQTADQVSVTFINLWSSHTTGQSIRKVCPFNSQTSALHNSQTFWSRKWGPWRLCKWPGRAEKSFYWTKYIKQGYFAKKFGSNWSYLAEMVVQRFCRAYMESPPPAVFHYKYQSYKYERNTAGKSATDDEKS